MYPEGLSVGEGVLLRKNPIWSIGLQYVCQKDRGFRRKGFDQPEYGAPKKLELVISLIERDSLWRSVIVIKFWEEEGGVYTCF